MENKFETLNLLQLYDEDVESQLERSYPNTLADESNSGPIQGKSGMGLEPSSKLRKKNLLKGLWRKERKLQKIQAQMPIRHQVLGWTYIEA